MSAPPDPLELCAEALATARVQGLSADAPIHALASTLGAEFTEHTGPDGMYRDFGPVECHYERLGPDEPWQGRFLVVRVDRLPARVRLDDLQEELRRVGQAVVPLPPARAGTDDLTLKAPLSGSTITVDGDGTAIAIAAPVWPVPELPALPESRWRAVCESLDYMLPLTRVERAEWLADRVPDTAEAADWWTSLVHPLTTLRFGDPQRAADWAGLELWLLDRAGDAGAWPREEWVWRWMWFVRSLTPRAAAPHAGELTRLSLAALPMTVAQLHALPPDWRALSAADLRRARTARALMSVATTYGARVMG
ncbi:hypothetical protein [Dactylosporangium matsuzakiense]|uniref:Uncharacterized protein n=1 Tax=Dactylosporangium matsuzakiense TaxID=53360 RepID=A0A9W6NM85_9ACTN|nr:hypothetical protein [Dactylosporangium matsuzakiense]UWZ43158.1 hypothetical protein Dmats_37565 [Dactylosporangium matsuzakiense]GLL02755.1 hypothetical protein GCM10017581_044970 [Dactylosporangium matsuzakiense]